MKDIVRSILFNSFSLYLITAIFSGVRVTGGVVGYLICGLVLSILNIIGKPVFGILSVLLNIVTLGLFSLVSGIVFNGLILILLERFMRQISFNSFTIQSIHIQKISTPALFVSGIFIYLVCGIIYSVIKEVLSWLI